VDAGPMQIQWWEGAALSRANAVTGEVATAHERGSADVRLGVPAS